MRKNTSEPKSRVIFCFRLQNTWHVTHDPLSRDIWGGREFVDTTPKIQNPRPVVGLRSNSRKAWRPFNFLWLVSIGSRSYMVDCVAFWSTIFYSDDASASIRTKPLSMLSLEWFCMTQFTGTSVIRHSPSLSTTPNFNIHTEKNLNAQFAIECTCSFQR